MTGKKKAKPNCPEATAPERAARSTKQKSKRDLKPRRAVPITEFESKEIRWLWPGRIPLGKLTIVDGDPGLGKSVITNADLAARVSVGGSMPDGSTGLGKPSSVVLVIAEDDIADTVRPRLEAAGADIAMVCVEAVERDGKGHVVPLVIPDDLDRLAATVKEAKASLVIIDPITAYLGEQVNTHNDASVRRALGPLKELAEATGAAVVMVRHLNKSGEGKALYRGGGSIAFSGAARSGLMVDAIPDDSEGWCALAQVKVNLARKAPTLRYRVVSALDASPEFPYDVPVIEWGGEVDLTADQLFAKKDARKVAPERAQAKEFLVEVLADGPLRVMEVQALASGAGHAFSTVKKAATELGIDKTPIRRKEGKKSIKGWEWSLPPGLKWTSG